MRINQNQNINENLMVRVRTLHPQQAYPKQSTHQSSLKLLFLQPRNTFTLLINLINYDKLPYTMNISITRYDLMFKIHYLTTLIFQSLMNNTNQRKPYMKIQFHYLSLLHYDTLTTPFHKLFYKYYYMLIAIISCFYYLLLKRT